MKRPIGVQIEGSIYANNSDGLTQEEFLDAFIEFGENRGWSFGGGSFQIDEEGNHIDDIEEIVSLTGARVKQALVFAGVAIWLRANPIYF